MIFALINANAAKNWIVLGGDSGLSDAVVTYFQVSFLLAAILMGTVSIGIAMRSRVWGYYLGNIWALLAIANLFLTVGMPATAPLWKRFPKSIIPIAVLLLLNLVYRRVFFPVRLPIEADSRGEAS